MGVESWMSPRGPWVRGLVPSLTLLGGGIFKRWGLLGSFRSPEDRPSKATVGTWSPLPSHPGHLLCHTFPWWHIVSPQIPQQWSQYLDWTLPNCNQWTFSLLKLVISAMCCSNRKLTDTHEFKKWPEILPLFFLPSAIGGCNKIVMYKPMPGTSQAPNMLASDLGLQPPKLHTWMLSGSATLMWRLVVLLKLR